MLAIIAMQIEGHRVANGKETLGSVHPKFMQKANIQCAAESHPKQRMTYSFSVAKVTSISTHVEHITFSIVDYIQ